MLWGRWKLCSLGESSSRQAFYRMSDPTTKSFSNTMTWCCKPVLNIRSSSLILPSTSGSSYISMSSEIIQVWSVLQHTLCNSIYVLSQCNLHCRLTSMTTISACIRPIYFFVESILHHELTLHDLKCAACMFLVPITTVSRGLAHHAMLIEWLMSICF